MPPGRIGIGPCPRSYLTVYATVGIAVLGLLLPQAAKNPSGPVMATVLVIVSLLLVRVNLRSMEIGETFPDLARIPLLRRLLGLRQD